MAALSPMTWNWNWKLVVTGAAALTGVLGLGAPLELAGPAPHPPAIDDHRIAAQITAVSALEEETRRLDERLTVTPVSSPSRNLFRFGDRPVAARRAAPPAAVVASAPIVVAPAPFPLRLTGIAVDVVNGVEQRTAIVSGPSGVELAANGQTAAPGYRVVAVGDTFAEVERTSDGARQRLNLKP
jgi:hypothetical protein